MKSRFFFLCFLLILPFSFINAQTAKGKASYYAQKFAGQRTASGEIFSPNDFTCAHRTYPFGTMLLVKNMDNGSEVVVRVNDRGPFIRGRIIDLSYVAAKQLGMIQRGTCNVEVSLYDPDDTEIETPLMLMVDISPKDLYGSEEHSWNILVINDAPIDYKR